MRKLILKMSTSLDGFVGGPDGELEWLFRHDDAQAIAWTVDAISQVGVHIMGFKYLPAELQYFPCVYVM